ncbi:MAG: hypothetical protein J0M17_12410 [Planctomycetes bacterium]|nr:hypothetical protein [Planctomycetota bacterium]
MAKRRRNRNWRRRYRPAASNSPNSGDSPAVVGAAAGAAAGVVAAETVLDFTAADYDKQRTACIALLHENTAQHDKAILTLAAGALGLSVTFLKDISKNPAEGIAWLGFGWFFLIASLICMIGSFLTGRKACKHQISTLDKHYSEQQRPSDENFWSDQTEHLNLAAFVSFLLGVGCLVFFSWVNLEKHGEPNKPDALQQTVESLKVSVESLVEQSNAGSEGKQTNSLRQSMESLKVAVEALIKRVKAEAKARKQAAVGRELGSLRVVVETLVQQSNSASSGVQNGERIFWKSPANYSESHRCGRIGADPYAGVRWLAE